LSKIKISDITAPKVSVVVVSFNSEKYISKCINSLLKTDYPDFEIIVVDNDSKDNTRNELNKFQESIKFI